MRGMVAYKIAGSVGLRADRRPAVMSFTALVALVLIVAVEAAACRGCGCRGGPGYRAPDGKCVSWEAIGRTCGSPPTLRCSPENPHPRADRAAEEGADRLERPQPRVK